MTVKRTPWLLMILTLIVALPLATGCRKELTSLSEAQLRALVIAEAAVPNIDAVKSAVEELKVTGGSRVIAALSMKPEADT
ncbi:MAG: hypothetical protein AB1331_00970 [Bacillota bacterium]